MGNQLASTENSIMQSSLFLLLQVGQAITHKYPQLRMAHHVQIIKRTHTVKITFIFSFS